MFNYDCHILVMYVIVYGPLPTIVVAFVPINIVYCLVLSMMCQMSSDTKVINTKVNDLVTGLYAKDGFF